MGFIYIVGWPAIDENPGDPHPGQLQGFFRVGPPGRLPRCSCRSSGRNSEEGVAFPRLHAPDSA
jgi:hypothetical protein